MLQLMASSCPHMTPMAYALDCQESHALLQEPLCALYAQAEYLLREGLDQTGQVATIAKVVNKVLADLAEYNYAVIDVGAKDREAELAMSQQMLSAELQLAAQAVEHPCYYGFKSVREAYSRLYCVQAELNKLPRCTREVDHSKATAAVQAARDVVEKHKSNLLGKISDPKGGGMAKMKTTLDDIQYGGLVFPSEPTEKAQTTPVLMAPKEDAVIVENSATEMVATEPDEDICAALPLPIGMGNLLV